MAASVHAALIAVLTPRLGDVGARAHLDQLVRERRYVRDVWS